MWRVSQQFEEQANFLTNLSLEVRKIIYFINCIYDRALFLIFMYALEISVVPSGKCSGLNTDIEKQVINTSAFFLYLFKQT